GLEPVEQVADVLSAQDLLCLLREGEKELSMPVRELAGLAGGLELLGGVLPDRLQHPEPGPGATEQALVDERVKLAGFRLRDLLRGFDRAATAKHGQACEEQLLGR